MTYLHPNQQRTLAIPDYDLVHWVEANRVLDRRQSAEVGAKKVSRTPYLKPLYEWFLDDKIKTIIIQKPAQIGITDWVVDCILWIAANDPSPTALFLADQDTARKIMRFRLDPAFRELGLVKKRQARNVQQQISKFEIQLANGFYLAVSWGSSIAQTASMSFKRVFCDEVNKPGYAVIGDEGDTISRISERMETYGDSKFVLLSTPTLDTGTITEEFNSADTLYDYGCKCPDCGHLQRLTFDNVVWTGGSKATPEQIRETARYHCVACGTGWTDKQREEAVSNGQAIVRSGTGSERVAYQLHRLNSLFKGGNMARMIRAFLSAKSDPLKLQNIVNSTFGEPWIPKVTDSQEAKTALEKCKTDVPKMTLPQGTVALIAGVDMQQRGFWYAIRAYTTDGSSHLVDYGFLVSWEELSHIIFERKINGLGVWRMMIDTGGTRAEDAVISRTEEAYLWIRSNMRRNVQIFACKGASRTLPTKLSVGRPIETTPSGKRLNCGIRIVQVNTEACKDAIMWQIESTAENPGAAGGFYLHADTDNTYTKQMTSEEKRVDRRGNVKWVQVLKHNHLLDCEVYIHAGADPELFGGILSVRRRKKPKKKQEPKQEQRAQQEVQQGAPRRQRFRGPNPYLVG